MSTVGAKLSSVTSVVDFVTCVDVLGKRVTQKLA